MIYTATIIAFIVGFWVGRISKKNTNKNKYAVPDYFYPHF
jgi:hypothetical protein